MKTCIKKVFLLSVLVTGLGLIIAGRATAQTFTLLHTFDGTSDGVGPEAQTLWGNTLYGTTEGAAGGGTVFAMNTDGTGFATLHTFSAYEANSYTNSGGSYLSGLVLYGNTLYGTAAVGGSSSYGTVFAVNADGTGFTTVYSFSGSDGAHPTRGLVLSGKTLYGSTYNGGNSDFGALFAVNTDGTAFTDLHSFAGGSDGENPIGLILSSNTLYGMANSGGSSGWGTVFKLNTDGTAFTNLHSFTGLSDGGALEGVLILSSNTLYGATTQGGSSANGTLFKLNIDGSGFRTLHSFTAIHGSDFGITNREGYFVGDLIVSGNTLYGTATSGGSFSGGTVFAMNTDGTGFTVLHSFSAAYTNSSGTYTNSDGRFPIGLILSGNTLYGTAAGGGNSGNGTVFSISLPVIRPQLTITRSLVGLILSWPTNAIGFALQSTTNLGSSAVWTTNSPAPIVVNGQNTITNPISGMQQFFQLIQ